MSVETLAAVLHHSRAKGTAKLVLVGIANHDGDGGSWPAVTTLARYANADVRTVQRALAKLVSLGELAIAVQAGGDRDTPDHARPNRYDVTVSCPPWCDRTTQHRDTRESRQANLHAIGGDTGVTPRHWRHRGGVTLASPGGVTLASPKPPTQLNPTSVSAQPQDARAMNTAPCADCGQGEFHCQNQQRHWLADERHAYRPMTGHHRATR